jgi:hypothetical protein
MIYNEENIYFRFEQYMQEHLNHKKLSVVQRILLQAQHNYKETWSTTAKPEDHSLTTMHMVTLHHLKVVIYSTIVMKHMPYATGMNILLWSVTMAVSIVQHRHLLLWCKLLFVYEHAIKRNTKNTDCGNPHYIQILLKSGLVNSVDSFPVFQFPHMSTICHLLDKFQRSSSLLMKTQQQTWCVRWNEMDN